MTIRVLEGDCLDLLPTLPADSLDACVTDPPYHLFANGGKLLSFRERGFMGQRWDGGDIAFRPATWAAVLRVLRPGAHLLAFGGTRTYHRLAVAIEDAGFEIRDQLAWVYGSGFPKSLDVSKAIDRAAGAEREVIGQSLFASRRPNGTAGVNSVGIGGDGGIAVTAPATTAARRWAGFGTALKPSWEPIVLARKPLAEGTVAANVLRHGTGALNIDGCRVAASDGYAENAVTQGINTARTSYAIAGARRTFEPALSGRWPANLCHDGSAEVLAEFAKYGESKSNAQPRHNGEVKSVAMGRYLPHTSFGHADSGSASRFFYSAKADAGDRLSSKHPTVKPVDLMRWLVRLVCPPGGTVLDPFAGSGTTGMACLAEGFDAVLIEREAEYVRDIHRRVKHVHGHDTPLFAAVAEAQGSLL